MHQPRAVVFDIGNVLVNWDPDRVYSQLLPDPAERRAFFARTGVEEMNLDVDRGAPFREHIYAHAERHPEDGELIRAWHDRWPEMFQPAIEGSVSLLRLLRLKGVPVHALSNFGAGSFDLACTLYPVLLEFDIPVISGRERAIKPEPRIYEILEERTGLAGADIFFTDDRTDNIAAARKRGWQGHLFRNPDALALQLVELGLIAPHELG
ncbi:HAD family hydrolase [Oceanicella sp. SM1341]|uniref:HAD family hydrolase n=1 Tax=Oceanicella sp. SM1341 TaxID=1548889 RepID=UPI000E4EC3E2|nr:HAD family hydrolase [Oceanicella sp. SM1341]